MNCSIRDKSIIIAFDMYLCGLHEARRKYDLLNFTEVNIILSKGSSQPFTGKRRLSVLKNSARTCVFTIWR